MEPGTPYCGNCGYQLTGAVESSRCPECGKPIVDVLRRVGEAQPLGRRYESSTRIFGLPLVSIAFGPRGQERIGKACGIFAFGDVARGWVAFGGLSLGIFAFGGMASGVFAFGGLSLGVFSFGGMALAILIAIGGLAAGGVANGGLALGYVADGGMAVGTYARGGSTVGTHVVSPMVRDAEALRFFQAWGDYLGGGPGVNLSLAMTVGAAAVCVGALMALLIGAALYRRRDLGLS